MVEFRRLWAKRWFRVSLIGGGLVISLAALEWSIGLPTNGALALIGGVLTVVASVWENTTSRKREENNKQVLTEAKDVEQLREEVLDYERLTQLLENRGLRFSEMMGKYVNNSEMLIVSVTDQKGPENEDVGEETDDTKFVKWVIDELDGVALTSKTWAIPPDRVPETVQGGTREDIESWLDNEIYERYEGDYSALLPLIALVDLRRVYSKQDEESERHFGETLVMEVIEASDTFTLEDYAEALADKKIDVLDSVKQGDLRFFIPNSFSEAEIDNIRENQSIILKDISPPTLQGLADENNVDKLEKGLSEAEIEPSSEIAQSINEIAQIWKETLDEA